MHKIEFQTNKSAEVSFVLNGAEAMNMTEGGRAE